MGSMRKKQRGKSTPSEIESLVTIADRLTPDELFELGRSRFEKDLQFLKRLVMEQREKFEWAEKKPPTQSMVKQAKNFYDDLIADGYIKKDLSLFEGDRLEDYKAGQARDEASALLEELERTGDKHYKEVFRKWNKVYTINYETLCNSYLVALAQKISGRPIKNKTKVLRTLSSYRDGKHAGLFKSLVPQIRNSIQHQDFIIDPRKSQITFYDRKKTPLQLTIEEYADIFWESYFLMIAFDIASFDLKSGILDIVIEAVDVVDRFLKTHNLKLVRAPPGEEALSLLDWALLIKSRKVS